MIKFIKYSFWLIPIAFSGIMTIIGCIPFNGNTIHDGLIVWGVICSFILTIGTGLIAFYYMIN